MSNAREPIPRPLKDKLFHPFVRASANSTAQGLGPGLYIASEIAKAHDGPLAVTCVDNETCLTFRMPTDDA